MALILVDAVLNDGEYGPLTKTLRSPKPVYDVDLPISVVEIPLGDGNVIDGLGHGLGQESVLVVTRTNPLTIAPSPRARRAALILWSLRSVSSGPVNGSSVRLVEVSEGALVVGAGRVDVDSVGSVVDDVGRVVVVINVDVTADDVVVVSDIDVVVVHSSKTPSAIT